MVGRLLGDIEAMSLVRVSPVAREDLAEDWIQRFLDASVLLSVCCSSTKEEIVTHGGLMCQPLR